MAAEKSIGDVRKIETVFEKLPDSRRSSVGSAAKLG
jgi:hypothetical protein